MVEQSDSNRRDISEDRWEATSTPLHVLIIGGGVGGLCLAQGLKKSGISVAVYERDTSARFPEPRVSNFDSTGRRSGVTRLSTGELIPPLCATAIRTATLLTLLDQQLNQKFAKPIPPVEQADSGFGVNRLTLREILLADLDGIVHFGKTFERFHTVADGRVSAHFTDGTSATGDLLVGADGTNSVVRDLVVPDARIDDLDYAIYGKTPITPGMMEWVPEILVDSFTRIVSSDGTGMGLAKCRTREPASVATAKFAPALQLTEIQGYFSWTLSLTDERYRDADGPTLHRLARGMMKELHPALPRLVDEADVSATFPVSINSARPVEQWNTSNVTLLGDAIHTMSPGRGEGANTALRDAELLRHTLIDVATKGVPLVRAKAEYEAEMLRYGFEAVANSLNKPIFRRPTKASAGHTGRE